MVFLFFFFFFFLFRMRCDAMLVWHKNLRIFGTVYITYRYLVLGRRIGRMHVARDTRAVEG